MLVVFHSLTFALSSMTTISGVRSQKSVIYNRKIASNNDGDTTIKDTTQQYNEIDTSFKWTNKLQWCWLISFTATCLLQRHITPADYIGKLLLKEDPIRQILPLASNSLGDIKSLLLISPYPWVQPTILSFSYIERNHRDFLNPFLSSGRISTQASMTPVVSISHLHPSPYDRYQAKPRARPCYHGTCDKNPMRYCTQNRSCPNLLKKSGNVLNLLKYVGQVMMTTTTTQSLRPQLLTLILLYSALCVGHIFDDISISIAI